MRERSIEVDTSLPHIPVLRDRCLELLAPALTAPNATVIDATLGAGGHSAALLEAFPQVTVIGIDRDPNALALAAERIAQLSAGAQERFTGVHARSEERRVGKECGSRWARDEEKQKSERREDDVMATRRLE